MDSIEHGTFLHEDPELLTLMARTNIFFAPTFSVYKYHAERGTPHGRRRSADLRDDHVSSLLAAMEAGVKVVSGTDAGGWVHGNNAEEIVCLVDAGMTSVQAIMAATKTAAECIGREKDLGTLEEGKKADLIFVDGSPLVDVAGLEHGRTVSLVMKEGIVVYDERGD